MLKHKLSNFFMQGLVIGLISLALSFNAQGAEDPWLHLEKASQAARKLSYKGIFLYQNSQDIRSIEITHLNNGEEEFARMVSLDGQPREALSRGNNMMVFNSNKENVILQERQGQSLFPAILPPDIESVKAIYTLRFANQERISGREAQIVYLEPKDQFRYLYKLWLDKEFGLILKMSILDHQQKMIEQASFNQIGLFSGQDLNWFKPDVDIHKKYIMNEVPENKASLEKYCTIANLPAGYKEVSHVTRTMGTKPQIVHHWVFSDGLSFVSLFVNPIPKDQKSRIGETRVGSSHVHARVMNGNQIMVVGTVPTATIQKISNSIQDMKAH